MSPQNQPDASLAALAESLNDRFFTIWTGWTPLVVFRARTMRQARAFAASDELLQTLRRATVVGRPLLAFGAKVWVGPANEGERALLDGRDAQIAWLQKIDGS